MARVHAKTFFITVGWMLTAAYVYYAVSNKSLSNELTYQRRDNEVATGASSDAAKRRLEDKLTYYENALSAKSLQLAKLQQRLLEASGRANAKAVAATDLVHGSGNATAVVDAAVYTEVNESEPFFEVPSIFTVMPHLNNDRSLLQPYRSIGHVKHGATVVLGIPHVMRVKENYLLQTIESLIQNMDEQEKLETVIVVQVSEPWNLTYFEMTCDAVMARFADEVKAGIIEVIVPSQFFYPDFDLVPLKWGDSRERTRWRTKQNLDYAFLMMYCSHIAKYYVQLEDDIIAKKSYISMMKSFAETQEGWLLLEFSQLGFIGKLFKCDMLPRLIEFLLMFYEHKPVDWLLDNFFHVRECLGLQPAQLPGLTVKAANSIAKNCPNLPAVRKRYRPSLFQHMGYHSSLPGKVQKLQDKDFNVAGAAGVHDPQPIRHANPPGAMLTTTLKQYGKFSAQSAYDGKSVFWALNPQPGDTFTLNFATPLSNLRYRFTSGDEQHIEDKFYNSSVEAVPENPGQVGNQRLTPEGYIVVGKFNETALIGKVQYSVAEGHVPPDVGRVRALRIVVHEESHNWVIIKEILIEGKP